MRVLVTGSSGRIGRAVCARLSGEHQVIGLDRIASPATRWVGDVGDPALTERALDGADAVIHVAAVHAPHVGVVPDVEFERINVEASLALARRAVERGIRRFVFTSTTALYGSASTPPDAAGWVDENLIPEPRTIYHRSKLAAESALQRLAGEHGLSLAILRMSRCFSEPLPLMAVYRLHRGIDARDVADAHACALNLAPGRTGCWVVSGTTPFQRDDLTELKTDAPAVLHRRVPELVKAFADRGWTLPASIDRVYVAERAWLELGWKSRHGWQDLIAAEPERSVN